MMVLYHLHNPTAPAFVTTCNGCHLDIEAGQGWCCRNCQEYDLCNACYQKDSGIGHPHNLMNHSSMVKVMPKIKTQDKCEFYSFTECLIFWCILLNAVVCNVNVLSAARLGVFSAMGYSAKKVLPEVVLSVRECDISFNFMLEQFKESECHVPRCRDYGCNRSLIHNTELVSWK